MTDGLSLAERANWARFRGGSFYESYFIRANHPSRPLAFWIRYTLFCPRATGAPVGELWGIVFDRERGRTSSFYREVPWSACAFASDSFDVRVGDARIGPGIAHGEIEGADGNLAWDLRFAGAEAPLFLLPERMYERRFPAAKALTPAPLARFEGVLKLGAETIAVENWIGSQNHNWGTRHTDHYAWGQVAGFDGAPDAFLEVATARLKFGPVWIPAITTIVLRRDGREHAFSPFAGALFAHGRVRDRTWTFGARGGGVSIEGEIAARPEDFVTLSYRNPIGGVKTCLNSKLADCTITLRDGARSETLRARSRAAFEILS